MNRVASVPVLLSLFAGPALAQADFLRGDPNGDGVVDVSDAMSIESWRLRGSAASTCLDAADTGDGGAI